MSFEAHNHSFGINIVSSFVSVWSTRPVMAFLRGLVST